MKYKKLLSMSIALMAISGSAQALDILPTLTSTLPNNNTPNYGDWNFWAPSQSVNITYNATAQNYTLTASSTGNFTFFNQYNVNSYIGTASVYSLSATFDQSGNFVANAAGSDYLKITGYFSATTAAAIAADTGIAAPTTSTNLLQANLTGFGYNQTQDTLGFSTAFTSAWSDQKGFTGGSTGESVYLYAPVGLNADGTAKGTNSLGTIISAFQGQNLSTAPTTTINGISSIASVPVPFSGVLFGTGLTTLLGLSRRSARKA
jgi:hypothetical protein